MDETRGKPMLTPLEDVSIKAQRTGGEPWLCKQGVAGSNPAVSTKNQQDKALRAIGPHKSPPDSAEKADAPPSPGQARRFRSAGR